MTTQPQPPQKSEWQQLTAPRNLMFLVLIITGAIGLAIYANNLSPEERTAAAESRARADEERAIKAKVAAAESEVKRHRSGVTVTCEREVRRRLRSPGSASFPWGHSTEVKRISASEYRLVSYVDSQNAFGALLRTEFICAVEVVGDDTSDPQSYRMTDIALQ